MIPEFSQGMKPFSQTEFRERLNEMVRVCNSMSAGGGLEFGQVFDSEDSPSEPQPFIRLTGKTLSSGTVNAWDYNWSLLQYDSVTDEFIPTDPVVTQATDGYLTARNSLERRNPTTALSGGTGDMPIGSGLPIASGTLKAIGTTSGQEADVPCWFKSVNTGTEEEPVMKLRPIFCVPNSFDCEGA